MDTGAIPFLSALQSSPSPGSEATPLLNPVEPLVAPSLYITTKYDHNMDTFGKDIIVPLQDDEVEARMNKSRYYHRHPFKSTGRSLQGLHPFARWCLEILIFKERTELLSQCEKIEQNWDPDVLRDEMWRYEQTRTTLQDMIRNNFDGDRAEVDFPEGTFPPASVRYPRVQAALEERGKHPEVKDLPLPRNLLNPDGPMSERNLLLDRIAQRTVPVSVAEIHTRTASDSQLLRAADMFKTNADRTEEKLAFLPSANAQGFSGNEPVAHHNTTREAAPTNGHEEQIQERPVQKIQGAASQSQEQQSEETEGLTRILEEDSPLGEWVDIDVAENFQDFHRAILNASAEDPSSVAALIVNWKFTKSDIETPSSKDAEGFPNTAVDSRDSDNAASTALGSGNVPDLMVESVYDLSDSQNGNAPSQYSLNAGESQHDGSEEESNADLYEEDMYQTTYYVGLSSPSTASLASVSSSTAPIDNITFDPTFEYSDDNLHENDAEDDSSSIFSGSDDSLMENNIENIENDIFSASGQGEQSRVHRPIAPTTDPPDNKGTHAPELIMPTFPLSNESERLHGIVSNHVVQVLRDSKPDGDMTTTATDRPSVVQGSPDNSSQGAPVVTAMNYWEVVLAKTMNATEHTSDLLHCKDARSSQGNAGDDVNSQRTQQLHNDETDSPREDVSTTLAEPKEREQSATSKSQQTETPLPQPSLSLAPAQVLVDDPVYEAVIFRSETPNETEAKIKDEIMKETKNGIKDKITGQLGSTPETKLSVPSLLSFNGDRVDDWASETFAAIHDFKFSERTSAEHNAPTNTNSVTIGSSQVEPQTAKDSEPTPPDNNAPTNPNSVTDPGVSSQTEPQPPKDSQPATPADANVPLPRMDLRLFKDLHITTPTGAIVPVTSMLALPLPNGKPRTVEDWATMLNLPVDNPALKPENGGTATPTPVYPFPVPLKQEEREKVRLVERLKRVADNFAAIFACYSGISIFVPSVRLPQEFYLAGFAAVGGGWVVMRVAEWKAGKARGEDASARKNRAVKRKRSGVCYVLAHLAGVATLLFAIGLYGTWMPIGPDTDMHDAVWSHMQTQTTMADTCPRTPTWDTVFSPMTTCAMNDPAIEPGSILPRIEQLDPMGYDIGLRLIEEFLAKSSADFPSTPRDSYGAPNAVVLLNPWTWRNPIIAIGASAFIVSTQGWRVQALVDRLVRRMMGYA